MKELDHYHDLTTADAMDNLSSLTSMNKILLIEDNPGDARLVEIFLAESDLQHCEVTNKATLAAGLELLERGEEFAAVLLDLTLPDTRGFETLERLVARFPQNNIIVLTGLADKELGVRAVKAGAQDFLIKGSFDSESLAKSLRYSIERNQVLKRLEETQRIANIGNWEYHTATRTLNASDEVYRIFGCPPKKMPALKEALIQQACPLVVLFEIQELVAVGSVAKKDLKIRQKDGTQRYVFVQCSANKGENGHIIFQGIIQDITERKLAEQGMIKSQERYQEIFTQSRDALFICTLEGQFIDFNQATLDLFGYTEKELSEQQNAHQLYHPAERKNEFLLKLKDLQAIKDYEISVVHKSGEMRECMITANILASEDFDGYNCTIRDITELKQAEKLRKAQELARQSTQMKERFVASISHEMRTPMNAIFGMSNILMHTDLDTEQLSLVRSIQQSSQILLGVVNDILEISSIQNSKIIFENEPFDLYDLLNNLVEVMQYKAQEKDLYLEVIIGPGVPRMIKGDKLRLNQVLYNLVGNSIKFTDLGYVKIFVSKLHDIGDSVQLKFAIEDTGIGIPADKIEVIFDTFTRIFQKDRVFEGTGLGLSISKNLIEQQGGKIGATSILGKGSIFFFDLIFETAAAFAPSAPPVSSAALLPDDTSFRLLLVEDHKMNQLVARKTLEQKWKNIRLSLAENGQIAIDMLNKEDFDIVLMDIQMPIMDGYEATQYIRQNFPPDKAKLPILAMTAHAQIAKDEKFRECGMDDFVLKPFEPDDLFYKISKYVKI